MQRSALFKESLLDAPAGHRTRTSYGDFYQRRECQQGVKRAGVATGYTPAMGKPGFKNQWEWTNGAAV